MPDEMTCADCVGQLTHHQTGVLAEPIRTVVDEHLAGCPDCAAFAEQLIATDTLLQSVPRPVSRSGLAPGDHAPAVLSALQQLADSLDRARADDLVQDVLTEALAVGEDLDLEILTRALVDRVLADGADERQVSAFAVADRTQQLDVDADTPDLFYPQFYLDGPDLGRFITSPNIWGGDNQLLGPEDDLVTAELLDQVNEALDKLPPPAGPLAQLVLLDGMPITAAAAAMRLSPHEAASALHLARIRLRAAVATTLS